MNAEAMLQVVANAAGKLGGTAEVSVPCSVQAFPWRSGRRCRSHDYLRRVAAFNAESEICLEEELADRVAQHASTAGDTAAKASWRKNLEP